VYRAHSCNYGTLDSLRAAYNLASWAYKCHDIDTKVTYQMSRRRSASGAQGSTAVGSRACACVTKRARIHIYSRSRNNRHLYSDCTRAFTLRPLFLNSLWQPNESRCATPNSSFLHLHAVNDNKWLFVPWCNRINIRVATSLVNTRKHLFYAHYGRAQRATVAFLLATVQLTFFPHAVFH